MHEIGIKRRSADEAYCPTPTMPSKAHVPASARLYQPTPPPDSVVVHNTPSRSKYPCCLGCLAAICLCCAIEECCSAN
ncbi:hypothetical protein BX666DRAFT_1894343 [Dichotomocladium elegans]|nr:hypothetical protein BX666DRAFT_1894343 [Dichotomocladium elegans]